MKPKESTDSSGTNQRSQQENISPTEQKSNNNVENIVTTVKLSDQTNVVISQSARKVTENNMKNNNAAHATRRGMCSIWNLVHTEIVTSS